MSVLIDLMRYRAQKNTIILPHWNRILQDGGVFYDTSRTYMQKLADDNQKYGSSLKLCINPYLTGNKIRTSGVNNFATKSYDIAPHSPQLGPELIQILDFNSGWDVFHATINSNNSFTSTASGGVLKNIGLTQGKQYECVIVGNTTGTTYITDNINLTNFSGNLTGSFNTKFQFNSSSSGSFYIRNVGICSTTITSISVREVLINDATQTTATNQPYLSKIAPIEKPSLLNPNGGSNYMTHPTISFAANDAWSVEVVLNWNGITASIQDICGKTSTSSIRINNSTNNFQFVNVSSASYSFTKTIANQSGKIATYSFIAKGDGSISLYINGIFSETISAITSFDIASFLIGRGGYIYSKFYHYSIFSKALSSSEVANRAALLRSIYPEIESVPIGTQTWAVRNFDAVCTPQGNLIPEVQAATNTEKITNAADRDFSSDTGFWTKSGASVVISVGACNFISSPQGSYISKGGLTLNKWFKITYDVLNYSSGNVRYSFGSNVNGTSRNANGTYSEYLYCSAGGGMYFEVIGAGTNSLSIDNVSVQEVGWSDSQNLYDYVYANTAGTVEQKTYAAVKAAAMWRSPNNDVALAANYSKLYNDFATKLLDMDIKYYNVANPTTPWGWGVPTESDWTTLQTYINNDANALEHLGTTYWTSGQGTNTTGFTALPAGYVKEDGTYAGSGTTAIFASSDDMSIPRLGKSIRLIKA